ncbi:hypothetical protein [Leisingera sp. JC1]|uniref:hypothetical protein n=1 Tax=Leisingera sp. JC1 TaxID=1855282 RepID=UPI001586133C|nr:hypothetical protein [Leisingera sp. JC1]
MKDARSILAEASLLAGGRKELTSYTIRHYAVARMLKAGHSLDAIRYESSYSDLKPIRSVARQYGLAASRDPGLTPPALQGVCVAGTVVYEALEKFYPRRLYDPVGDRG